MRGETFDWSLRVYYEDTDAGGVVYYANYLKFCERARTEWLRAANVDHRSLADMGVSLVVRSVALDYHRPAHLDDWLTVKSRLLARRPVALTLHQAIERGGEGLATARVEVVCVDCARFRPCPLPPAVAEITL
ncbi:MAG: tol-pal system-associated acyl-CoA thioesterase [Candidatus Competibacterales bacterium]